MKNIDRCFKAGLIAVVWLLGGMAQAEDVEKMIPSPVLEQVKPQKSSQPAPPTATQPAPPSSGQPAPPTAMQPVPPPPGQPAPPTAVRPSRTSQPAPPTAFKGPAGGGLPDLYVHEYSVRPSPPSRRAVLDVRINVYNQGNGEAGPFTVQWWPGDNYPEPGCTWRVEGLVPRGGRILQCSGYVYPSPYARINTGVYVDSNREVEEVNKRNNKLYREMPVTE